MLLSSTKSSSRRLTRFNPLSLQCLGTLKNQNIKNLIQLIVKKNKSNQTINKINYYLQQVIGIQYFKQLKMILSQTDYNTVIEKLNAQYRLQGTIIIEKRKRNDYFYVILDGTIKILDEVLQQNQLFQQDKQRQPRFQLINKLHPGDSFGETSLLSLKREATARVEAMTPCILLTIDYQTFIKIASKITLIKKQQVITLLSKSSLFYNINKTHIRDLIVEIQQCKYGLNEVIYASGHLHDSIYFIKSGIVEISENNVKLMTLVVGENFGVEYGDIGEGNAQQEGQGLKQRIRCQQAKSKSSDLVLYKLSFSRLKVLQGCYEEVLDNIHRDYLNKKRVSQRLMTNHQNIRKIMTSSNTVHCQNKKQFILRKRMKNRTVSKIPQWWGIVHKPQDERLKSHQSCQKQNVHHGGILGSKRIEELKRIASNHKSVPTEAVEEPLCRPLFGELKSTLSKKTMRKISVIDTDQTEIVRKKIKPNIKKDKLVNYAKSIVNCWDLTF